MNKDNRPLSPHLQIYKLPMAAKMSILHRITGVVSCAGLVLLTIWLAMTATGETGWHDANKLFHNALIVLILFAFSGALIYHLCNGIRHLTWDAGSKHLTIDGVKKSGKVTLIATAVLTLVLWIGIWW
ncbi:succinate dehydrogenase, cytochrome b556 subunit [Suttonella ornithocola]|uniref:Succinate dehydrogenase cytochrome b556 subunit n=1 Tax=Suttonella ornithocola TaxID=279832 RepID=A0A380MUD1_9GAMM|nr:succinate dehydrogenase, cytochrome b556 subunit [Suttonella ornithocola]SUO94957.1 Succinate dehydrogenase cytochrome b556 subunit [Suttonella ornithocola]